MDAKHFDKPRTVTKVSECVMNYQNRFLGHVIRADPQDPMRSPTTDRDLNITGVYTRRVGHPRYRIVKENCRWIYEKKMHEPYDPKKARHNDYVNQFAFDRTFWTKSVASPHSQDVCQQRNTVEFTPGSARTRQLSIASKAQGGQNHERRGSAREEKTFVDASLARSDAPPPLPRPRILNFHSENFAFYPTLKHVSP